MVVDVQEHRACGEAQSGASSGVLLPACVVCPGYVTFLESCWKILTMYRSVYHVYIHDQAEGEDAWESTEEEVSLEFGLDFGVFVCTVAPREARG